MNLTFDARHASPEFVILLSALEASGEAILITSVERDPLGPRIEYYNPAFARMTGYDRQEMIGQTPRILQGPRTERDLLDRMRASLASGEPFQGEAVNYRKDGSTYLVEWLVTPIRDGGGRISHWVSTQRDVTARREAEVAMRDSEARFRAFVTASSDVIYRMSPDWSELRQLDGRAFLADTAQPTAGWTAHYIHPDDQLDVRLIAVVSSIARETMEDTGPTEAFRAEFNDRLAALSRVQGLLSRSEVEPITMGALVRLELDALGASTAVDRVSVTGPDVVLKPSTVQTLALALHELATNARKHGALSHDRGHLSVTRRERMEDGECRVALEWTETGLETVMDRPFSGAESGGYGRELIEQALPHTLDARTSYVLRPPGVHCTIDVQARSGPQCEDKT